MKKFLVLTLVVFIGFFSLYARPREKEEIMQAASDVLLKNSSDCRRSAKSLNSSLFIIEENDAYTVVGSLRGSYAIVSNDMSRPDIA